MVAMVMRRGGVRYWAAGARRDDDVRPGVEDGAVMASESDDVRAGVLTAGAVSATTSWTAGPDLCGRDGRRLQ